MEVHDRPDGVTVVNDAYNANPDSMHAALQALRTIGHGERRTWAVLGEMLELGELSRTEHERVGAWAVELGTDQLVVVGAGAAALADGAARASGGTEVTRVAYQWDTIVRPDHRGHRLGLLMKIANLELLRRTISGVEIINTWNAAINEHMIAINEAVGFRAADVEWAWELDV